MNPAVDLSTISLGPFKMYLTLHKRLFNYSYPRQTIPTEFNNSLFHNQCECSLGDLPIRSL